MVDLHTIDDLCGSRRLHIMNNIFRILNSAAKRNKRIFRHDHFLDYYTVMRVIRSNIKAANKDKDKEVEHYIGSIGIDERYKFYKYILDISKQRVGLAVSNNVFSEFRLNVLPASAGWRNGFDGRIKTILANNLSYCIGKIHCIESDIEGIINYSDVVCAKKIIKGIADSDILHSHQKVKVLDKILKDKRKIIIAEALKYMPKSKSLFYIGSNSKLIKKAAIKRLSKN